jgi:hypothetical protein
MKTFERILLIVDAVVILLLLGFFLIYFNTNQYGYWVGFFVVLSLVIDIVHILYFKPKEWKKIIFKFIMLLFIVFGDFFY